MKVRIGTTNVAGLVRRQAERDPATVALVDGSARITWGELNQRVERHASGLAELGLVAGHRVAFVMANSADLVVCYLGILRGGLVAVPINPTSRPGEIARVLKDCGARVCFTDAAAAGPLREAIALLTGDLADTGSPAAASPPPVVVVQGERPRTGEIGYDDLPANGAEVLSPLDPEALAVLFYTSGTSGRPRAAMLSHRALLANIEQNASTRPPPVQPTDVVLGVLPMFHVYGLNAVLGQVLLTGATLVIGRRFDAEETLALVEREQVTCAPVAPPVIKGWLDIPDIADRLSTVTMLISGAAPLAEEAVRLFEERTGIAVEQGYGLTEAGPVVTSAIGAPNAPRGSSGRALPGVEVRVVDDTGADADSADPGEIVVRGRNLFSGYWPDGSDAPEPGSWLHTGDVGFLDADGDLFLVDRLKELVIVSGFNVYPSEIEDVVSEVRGVRECAVIGVPDAATGEAVVAYLVPDPDPAAGASGADLLAAVAAHCADRLARFKVPSRIELVERLPHSATGKVAKGRLRAGQARHEMGLS